MNGSVKREVPEHLAKLLAGIDSREVAEQAKLDEVSVGLCALLEHTKVSRAELARKLGWTPSRVTKVLSGEDNLTLRTLVRFLSVLDYDFDVVMRKRGAARARQPWDRSGLVLMFDGGEVARHTPGRTKSDIWRGGYQYESVVAQSDLCANDESLIRHEPVAG